MKVPKLEHGVDLDGRTGALLTTPFQQDFIDELKSTLPRGDRRWAGELRAWWVAPEHTSYAIDLMLRFWSAVDVIGDPDEGDYQVDRDGVITGQCTLGF